MSDYQDILSNASQLPVADQLRLIDDLAASMPDDQPPHLSKKWLNEINSRSDQIDANAVELESWSEVRKRLFAKHGISDAN